MTQVLRESRKLENKEHFVLFYSPEFEKQAKAILKSFPDFFLEGKITWQFFPDGFPNLFIENVEKVRGRDVVFMCSFLNHDMLLAQLAVMFALPRYSCRSLIVLCPYFPTGTMERVDTEGQVATAQTFARILSSIPLTLSGPAKLLIFDIHALQERFYFRDTVLPLLTTAIPTFIKQVLEAEKYKSQNWVIAFPDDGAQKRFGNKFPRDYGQIVCQKVRDGPKGRIVKIKDGHQFCKKEYHIVIVDDLVKTGGTLIECKNALLKEGAETVSCYVTHGVFPEDSWKRFTKDADKVDPHPFNTFWITETCPEVSNKIGSISPFEVIPTADSFAQAILHYQ